MGRYIVSYTFRITFWPIFNNQVFLAFSVIFWTSRLFFFPWDVNLYKSVGSWVLFSFEFHYFCFFWEVELFHYLNYLLRCVLKICFGVDTLRYDGYPIIKPSCLLICFYTSEIYVILVYHDHHLYNTKKLEKKSFWILLTCHLFLFLDTPLYLLPLNELPPDLPWHFLGMASIIILLMLLFCRTSSICLKVSFIRDKF